MGAESALRSANGALRHLAQPLEVFRREMALRPGGGLGGYWIEAYRACEPAADTIMVAAHVDAGERTNSINDFVGISTVADDVAEVPELVERAGGGENRLKGLYIPVNIGDNESTHGRRVSLLYRRKSGERSVARGAHGGDRAEELARVVVLRCGEDLMRRSLLHDAAVAHDEDAVGNLADDGEVVRDEEHGEAVLAVETFEKCDDLRLHGDVECGGGFVGDEKTRAVDERHGNHEALPLAT